MDSEEEIRTRLARLLEADTRYAAAAYDFVREAVSCTSRARRRHRTGASRRHISGRELLDGIRALALREFGPFAVEVFDEWGVHDCADFGHIVFNLVEHRLLTASPEDSMADFKDGYDFGTTFVKPFVEAGQLPDDLPKIA